MNAYNENESRSIILIDNDIITLSIHQIFLKRHLPENYFIKASYPNWEMFLNSQLDKDDNLLVISEIAELSSASIDWVDKLQAIKHSIEVIILTASINLEQQIKYQKLDFVKGYLLKPITNSNIIDAIIK
ncbi:MAG: hypothetical protein ACOVQE_01435 [Chitinophagaceae bacterium]